VVLPTLQNRSRALDVLRGVAVLGILLANIPSFADPSLGGFLGARNEQGIDRWIHAWTLVLVNGKFRSMLAVLFGVGVWLQYQKRSQVEGNWPWGYLKRSAWLAVFGLCHGIFIWFGDILFFYAGMAILTSFMVQLPARTLKGVIIGFAVLALLCGGGIAGSMVASGPASSDASPFGSLVRPEDISRVFATGSYLDQLAIRAILYAAVMLMLAFLVVPMLPLFLIGVLFARSGVLAQPSAHPRTRNAALGVGLGIGLPLNLLGLLNARGVQGLDILAEIVSGPILAIGYLMLIAVLLEKGRGARLAAVVSRVGQMSLTTYLSQSVLATFVFYSWGLGLFGKLSQIGQIGVVLAIWAVNLLFATWWLRRFPIGPMEWLLRSLTEGKRLPMSREKPAASPGAEPAV